ncbi:uncharacterized protein LY79DRAFT_559173 [Colletotrichum navitas]|uniref:Uncharacterized protein n=1 Tax=Colletotrichum navitas TaxID=681940 RepID=A0AAD8PWA2_9PEZI|nr:uncharacterized protein LY79DRAFT_559173 [Colletotrichum navitas]KAK1585255.1 hypothetical protein LY79DRAFT_559173 [Colletotrichum navitas]
MGTCYCLGVSAKVSFVSQAPVVAIVGGFVCGLGQQMQRGRSCKVTDGRDKAIGNPDVSSDFSRARGGGGQESKGRRPSGHRAVGGSGRGSEVAALQGWHLNYGHPHNHIHNSRDWIDQEEKDEGIPSCTPRAREATLFARSEARSRLFPFPFPFPFPSPRLSPPSPSPSS